MFGFEPAFPTAVLIIDAYNLLHQWHSHPGRGGPGDDLRALAGLIRRCGLDSGRVLLVCDGASPGDGGVHLAGVEAVFSGHSHSADEVIIETVRRSSAARGVTVVSSDRAVATACRRLGATAVECRVFLARAVASAARPRGAEKPQPPLPLGDAETGVWLAYFGVKVDHPQRNPAEPAQRKARETARVRDAEHEEPRRREPVAEPVAAPEPWFDEAARVWPGLTVHDLLMDRWLKPGPAGPARRGRG